MRFEDFDFVFDQKESFKNQQKFLKEKRFRKSDRIHVLNIRRRDQINVALLVCSLALGPKKHYVQSTLSEIIRANKVHTPIPKRGGSGRWGSHNKLKTEISFNFFFFLFIQRESVSVSFVCQCVRYTLENNIKNRKQNK